LFKCHCIQTSREIWLPQRALGFSLKSLLGHHGIGKTILLYISLGQQWRGVWNKALSDFWCNVKFSSSVTTEYKEIWKENLVIYQKSLKAFLQAPLQLNQAIKQQPINLWLRLWLEELTHWSMLWTKNNKFGEMYYLHRSSSNIRAWNFLIILELFWYPNVAKKNMMMLFKGCKLFFSNWTVFVVKWELQMSGIAIIEWS